MASTLFFFDMVKCSSPGCSKEQYHLGLCEGSLDVQNKRRVEDASMVLRGSLSLKKRDHAFKDNVREIKKHEPYKYKRNKLALTYGLDLNGRPYDNPRYKFYATGDVDGDHWMCVYKPTHLIFPVPFPKESNMSISQLVYMSFPGDDSSGIYAEDERYSSRETDAEEEENGANMLLDLQLSSPVDQFEVEAKSDAPTYSAFENLFSGLQCDVKAQAKNRLRAHSIDPDTIFLSFNTIQPDIRRRISKLLLEDIDPSTFAYQIIDSRLNAFM